MAGLGSVQRRGAAGDRARRRRGAAVALAFVLGAGDAWAATPLADVSSSPDTTLALAAGPTLVRDEQVVHQEGAATPAVTLFSGLPSAADVTAYAIDAQGRDLFSLHIPAELPNASSGPHTYRPGDVVRHEAGDYTLAFDGESEGLPAGATIDALAVVPSDGSLLISFDAPLAVGGISVRPEDLVQRTTGGWALFFDGSAAGVPSGLDLDAAHLLSNGHLLLSFDAAGVAGGVPFEDEDVLEFDPMGGTFEVAIDASADPAWNIADLDAFHAVESAADNCPGVVNPHQRDFDGDGQGDPCDADADADGLDAAAEALNGTDPLDPDTDDDGLSDFDEVNTYPTSPIDPDSDDDGLLDGAEIGLGTDPLDPDHDDDGICDGGADLSPTCSPGPDNCPFVGNQSQTNSDAQPAGDDCQCGDVDGDDVVDAGDLQVLREHLVGATLSAPFVVTRCNVIGPSDGGLLDCDVADASVLERLLEGASVGTIDRCVEYLGP